MEDAHAPFPKQSRLKPFRRIIFHQKIFSLEILPLALWKDQKAAPVLDRRQIKGGPIRIPRHDLNLLPLQPSQLKLGKLAEIALRIIHALLARDPVHPLKVYSLVAVLVIIRKPHAMSQLMFQSGLIISLLVGIRLLIAYNIIHHIDAVNLMAPVIVPIMGGAPPEIHISAAGHRYYQRIHD